MNAHIVFLYALVGLGAALGGMVRFGTGELAARLLGDTFPWGTFLVNVIGSTFIGFFATLVAPEGRLLVPASARAFVMVGLCGGFTTFSTFSVETLAMVRDGQIWKASINITATVLLCLVGVWAGYVIGTAMNQR